MADVIKALEWSKLRRLHRLEGPEVVQSWEGVSIGIRWATAIECTDGRTTLLSEPTCERFDTLDEAMKAAQSDYELRIMSAFIPSPVAASSDVQD